MAGTVAVRGREGESLGRQETSTGYSDCANALRAKINAKPVAFTPWVRSCTANLFMGFGLQIPPGLSVKSPHQVEDPGQLTLPDRHVLILTHCDLIASGATAVVGIRIFDV